MKFNNLGRVLWSSSSRVIVDSISCETNAYTAGKVLRVRFSLGEVYPLMFSVYWHNGSTWEQIFSCLC